MDIQTKSTLSLLRLYVSVLATLNKRGIALTRNAPTGDYAEWLVIHSYGLKAQPVGTRWIDAIDPKTHKRYQIKGVVAKRNERPRLGVIAHLDPKEFDYLIAVIFADDYSVREAFKIPHRTLTEHRERSGASLTAPYSLHLSKDLVGRTNVKNIRRDLLASEQNADTPPA